MNFKEKIETIRNSAQESQSATKIVDGLSKLFADSDVNSSYRWIWELIQNAKDVANLSGSVSIRIDFNEENKVLSFEHNGKLFQTQNIVYLIEQVSTKDRDKKSKVKTTGKFGTGFLTTHLLSKIVSVSGFIQDDEENPYAFSTVLDRSSSELSEIINAIQKSCEDLGTNAKEIVDSVNENNYNTCFTYELDEQGVKTAKLGLNNLLITAPYVFACIEELNKIEVYYSGGSQIFERSDVMKTEADDFQIMDISINTDGVVKKRTILSSSSDNCEVLVEVQIESDQKRILPYSDNLPRLFCDFPLLGSDEFAFPVVVNSSCFNPTEPRDGVFLTAVNNESVNENYQILVEALTHYKKVVTYLNDEKYIGLYNIVKVVDPVKKNWLSIEFYTEKIESKIKEFLLEKLKIETHLREQKGLDVWSFDNVLIASDDDQYLRDNVWDLTSSFKVNSITKYDENDNWFNSLWLECRNYGLKELLERVEKYGDLTVLDNSLCDGKEVIAWLNELIELYSIFRHDVDFINLDPQIFPNQNGDFCTYNKLFLDDDIEDVYKDLGNKLNFNIREKLLFKGVDLNVKFIIKKYSYESMFDELLNNFERGEFPFDVFREIACLSTYTTKYESDWVKLLIDLYGKEQWNVVKVKKVSKNLYNKVIGGLLNHSFKGLSECGNIDTVVSKYGFNNEKSVIKWYVKIIDLLNKENKLSKFETYSILPNQNNIFKKLSGLYADDNDYAEVFKDVAKCVGYDVRNDLLRVELPIPNMHSRTLEDYAHKIVEFIRDHKNNLGNNEEEKEIFMNTYRVLKKCKEDKTPPKCFKDLITNLYWFFNEDQIAEDVDTVQDLKELLKTNNIADIQELKSVLAGRSIDKREEVIIDNEFLAAWGITTKEELDRVLMDKMLDTNFVHNSSLMPDRFSYVQEILLRSKENIFKFLNKKPEYDMENLIEISKTIFLVRKNDEEIFIITRPSDFNKVILYYQAEFDTLDYEKDWELWVENGETEPQKITFGKILKITGVNKLLLWKLK